MSIPRTFHTAVYSAVAALSPSRFPAGRVTKEDQSVLQATTPRRAAVVREVEGEAVELEMPAVTGSGRYSVAVDVYEPKGATFEADLATTADLVAVALEPSALAASGRERIRTQRIAIRATSLSDCDQAGYGRVRFVVSAVVYR